MCLDLGTGWYQRAHGDRKNDIDMIQQLIYMQGTNMYRYHVRVQLYLNKVYNLKKNGTEFSTLAGFVHVSTGLRSPSSTQSYFYLKFKRSHL